MALLTRLIALWFTGYLTGGTYKMRKQEARMKYIATMALMLNLGVASVYAQPYPVKMVFSGTGAPSTVNLQQPNTNNSEDNYAGNGTLIHLSRCQGSHSFSASVQHLLGPK